MNRSPDLPINYLQPPLGYLLRLPCGDDAADSPLDEPARDRAEQAAAFLRYERIGQIFTADRQASRQTAEILWLATSWDFTDQVIALEHMLAFTEALRINAGLPCVLVATQQEIESALTSLIPGANVCGEHVAPGGIISLHRAELSDPLHPHKETVILPRARHMIMDFSFTDLEKAVAWKETSPA
jgi:hypothetical protein